MGRRGQGVGAVSATEGMSGGSLVEDLDADSGRLLFRYVTVDEWQDYRQIMAVFAGTFFSDFTPEEIEQRLSAAGTVLSDGVVAVRLESLRRWGNLTVSSVTGTPASLADYYRRRNRYLITRAGQEVHEAVEGVLTRIDEVRDVSTGRLRSLREGLEELNAADVAALDAERLDGMVRAVFDPHQAFTTEITQFFAAINQWQNRYDLTPDEFTFFAQVLVSYVADRLGEIERVSRPIAAAIAALADRFELIASRAGRGLASRVEEAGLSASVSVGRSPGSSVDDWALLRGWFVGSPTRPARIEQLRRDAVAAVRTLTLNLTRLSRVGVQGSSRRADLLRLARLVADDPGSSTELICAGLGLFGANHWGAVAEDVEDPVSLATSWWDAPQAAVPVSLRERGDTAARGLASPMADRSAAQHEIKRRRQQELAALKRVDAELLALAGETERPLSPAAFSRLRSLIGQALQKMPVRASDFIFDDDAVSVVLRRRIGEGSELHSTEGTLRFADLVVTVRERRP